MSVLWVDGQWVWWCLVMVPLKEDEELMDGWGLNAQYSR